MKKYINLQSQIIQVIEAHGGEITWKKEYDAWARLSYKIYRNEPKLSIEAILKGQKFGVIIHTLDEPIEKIYLSKNHQIFNVNDLQKFVSEFNKYRDDLTEEAS